MMGDFKYEWEQLFLYLLKTMNNTTKEIITFIDNNTISARDIKFQTCWRIIIYGALIWNRNQKIIMNLLEYVCFVFDNYPVSN